MYLYTLYFSTNKHIIIIIIKPMILSVGNVQRVGSPKYIQLK